MNVTQILLQTRAQARVLAWGGTHNEFRPCVKVAAPDVGNAEDVNASLPHCVVT